MPGVDFERIRAVVTMEAGAEPAGVRAVESIGASMVRELSLAGLRPWPPSWLFLGERGERSLLLPSLPQSWQRAGAVGGSDPAEPVSGRDRPLPSPGPRHPLDSPLVRASRRVIPTKEASSHHPSRGSREVATGTDFVPKRNHRFS